MSIRTVLHVGAGGSGIRNMPQAFYSDQWKELRLDIDSATLPDIVGSMLDMSAVADESVDAIYSSHNIEHVYAHEVPLVLNEFLRVLKPDGFLVATCPDLQSVAKLVADDKLIDAAYISPAGPITPLDILYGLRSALAEGNHYMAHKCGFTLNVLLGTLQAQGFQSVVGIKRPAAFDLWAVASKKALSDAAARNLAQRYLPS